MEGLLIEWLLSHFWSQVKQSLFKKYLSDRNKGTASFLKLISAQVLLPRREALCLLATDDHISKFRGKLLLSKHAFLFHPQISTLRTVIWKHNTGSGINFTWSSSCVKGIYSSRERGFTFHLSCFNVLWIDSAGFNHHNFFKWWEYLSVCTLPDERLLQQEFNTSESTCVQMEKHD